MAEQESHKQQGSHKHSEFGTDLVSARQVRLDPHLIHKITPWIPALIIFISSILGIMLVWPLFGPGIPMNIDLPFHYGRVLCYAHSEMWSLPTAWCTHGQAGIATFQGYATLPFHVVAFLDWFMDTLWAFKIMLVLILFALPAGAYYLLRSLGKPLAGAFAYAFLLLEHGGWHSGAFEKIFFVGLFSNALGSAMLLFSLAFAIRFFREPTMKRLISTTIITSLFFLAHAATFMYFPIPLLLLAYLYRSNAAKHWKWFLAYPLLVFLLVGYWFVPFLYKMNYYVSAGGGTVKTAEIAQFFWNPLNKILAYLGIAGLIFMLLNKKTEYRAIGLCALAIIILWTIGFVWEGFPYFNYIQMIRNLAELRSLFLIGAAVLLAYLAEIKIHISGHQAGKFENASENTSEHASENISKNAAENKSIKKLEKSFPWLLLPALIVVGVIMSQTFSVTENSSRNIMLSSMGNIPTLESLYKSVEGASGRILVEDTLFNFGNTPLSLAHPWSASPAYSTKEFLGTGDNLYNRNDYSNAQMGNLFNASINDWSDQSILDTFEALNIEYVIAYTPAYISRLGKISGMTLVRNDTDPWLVIKTPIAAHWFSIPGATIESSAYHGTWATVSYTAPQPSLLHLKVRHWPNWRAAIDGVPLSTQRDSLGLIQAPVPEGKHTISFTYRMIWVDWIGYMLTAVGIGLLGWMWRKDRGF